MPPSAPRSTSAGAPPCVAHDVSVWDADTTTPYDALRRVIDAMERHSFLG